MNKSQLVMYSVMLYMLSTPSIAGASLFPINLPEYRAERFDFEFHRPTRRDQFLLETRDIEREWRRTRDLRHPVNQERIQNIRLSNAVPEPSTMAFLAAGFAGMFFNRRRLSK